VSTQLSPARTEPRTGSDQACSLPVHPPLIPRRRAGAIQAGCCRCAIVPRLLRSPDQRPGTRPVSDSSVPLAVSLQWTNPSRLRATRTSLPHPFLNRSNGALIAAPPYRTPVLVNPLRSSESLGSQPCFSNLELRTVAALAAAGILGELTVTSC
jgi:hypothetical protein